MNEQGDVNIIQNDAAGEIDQTTTRVLNGNQKNLSLNSMNVTDLVQSLKPIESVDQTQIIKSGKVEFKIAQEFLGQFTEIKIVRDDGSELPEWVKFDPQSGTLVALPPEGEKDIKLKIIIRDNDKITIKEMNIVMIKSNEAIDKKAEVIEDEHFKPFKDQIAMQNEDWDNYGESLIKRL